LNLFCNRAINSTEQPEQSYNSHQASADLAELFPVTTTNRSDAIERISLITPIDSPYPLTSLARLDVQVAHLALQIPMSTTAALFYQALNRLHQQLHFKIDNQPFNGSLRCPLQLTASATADFIDQWQHATDMSAQLVLINNYRDKTTPLTNSNMLAVVGVAALCVALGASIGFLIGSWAGPASVLTASIGGMTGLLIASTLVGATLLGSAGTAGAYHYFFRSSLQTAHQAVIEQAMAMITINEHYSSPYPDLFQASINSLNHIKTPW
jgi:hypothetical protein